MNVGKRFQGLQQWSKEKMGREAKTSASDDWKAMETEMNMRHEGMERMHSSMHGYVKGLNKRSDGDGREKMTAIASVGNAMSKHGQDFEDGNTFGECLIGLGQANERMARFQDTYSQNATATWLEALERSLQQMKDYQNARKKLESRRSAYDSSVGKLQKAKSGDYRAEEELRSSKIKYEESAEDVQRRMQDIVDAEQENTQQLYSFLEAELSYHDRCREVLLQAQRSWPAPVTTSSARPQASRTNTNTLSRVTTYSDDGDDDFAPPMPSFRNGGGRTASGSSTPMMASPRRENPGFDFNPKPSLSRQNTNDLSRQNTNDQPRSRLGSMDPSALRYAMPLRPNKTRQFSQTQHNTDVFNDQEDEYDVATRSSSPATSVSQSGISRSTSYSTLDSFGAGKGGKKAPPPPPPSRSTKPPPPPPPMKRSALSSSVVPTI